MSRLAYTQHRKNIRRTFFFGLLTTISIVAFIFLGIPTLAKIAVFISDINNKPPIVSDNTPPAPPRFDSIPEATNKKTVKISGSTEPGANVIIFLNNKQKEILANNSGKFSTIFSLKKGKNTVSAYVMDIAGNKSQKTKTFTIVFDNTPPEITINEPENKKEFFGSKQKQVSIKGITEAGINLDANGRPVAVSENGEFIFTTSLSEGENKFTFKAVDAAGNSQEESIILKFTP